MNDTENKSHIAIVTAATAAATSAAAALVGKDIEYIKRDIGDIKQALKEQNNIFVSQQEHGELSKKVDDHEQRIRIMERYVWIAIGGGYIINMVIGFYLLYKQ